jgi:transcriptional regulator with XRE-family HTH domain
MAAKLGVAPRPYQYYEAGTRLPQAEGLVVLAQAGIDVNWLLTGKGSLLREEKAESRSNADNFDENLWQMLTAAALVACREEGVLDRMDPEKFVAMIHLIYDIERDNRLNNQSIDSNVVDMQKYRRFAGLL